MELSVLPDPRQAITSLKLSATGALRALSEDLQRRKREAGGPSNSEHAIAAAAISLHTLREIAGSEKIQQLICSSAAEALKLDGEAKTGLPMSLQQGTSLWQEASQLAAASCEEEVCSLLTSLQMELEQYWCLLQAFIRLSLEVLGKNEVQQFLNFVNKSWWTAEVERHISKLGTDGNPISDWSHCVQSLSLIHFVQSVHACVSSCVEESTTSGYPRCSLEAACKEWLCRHLMLPTLRVLASSVPRHLHSVYQGWVEDDRHSLQESALPATSNISSGHILRTCNLLCCAMSLLSAGASFDEATLLDPSVETILRLSNHYQEQLTQIVHLQSEGMKDFAQQKFVKMVPKEAPLKLWYLILHSSLHLHANLTHLHTSPALGRMSSHHNELFRQLLFSIEEFCDGLREIVSSYHTELCVTTLLHDSTSHDWQNEKAFFEGERASFSVQMWLYHLLGLKHDLWTICPGPVAVKLLSVVTATSVAHLAQRYNLISPSYRRVGQFRADIMAVLIASASLLPHLSAPAASSVEVSKIHQSCSQLLTSMALVGSPLEQLEQALSTCDGSPTLGGEHTPLEKWMDFVPLSHFNLFPIYQSLPPSGCHDDDTLLSDFLILVSLPYPQWDLLLKVLLSRGVSFAASLCKFSSTACSAETTARLSLVLAHCYHQPDALTLLHTCLGTHKCISKGTDAHKACTSLEFLFQMLRETTQAYVLSQATGFGSKTLQSVSICCHPPPDLGGFFVLVLNGLERQLMQLPKPVLNLLWNLSESLSGTVAVTEPGQQLAKLVGLLLCDWLTVPDSVRSHMHSSVLVSMDTYFSLLKHTLMCAGAPIGKELSPLSQEWLEAWQQHSPLVREGVKQFGSNLHSQRETTTPPGSEIPTAIREVTAIEFEVIANLLTSNTHVTESLKFLHAFLKANMDSIVHLIHSPSPPPPLHHPNPENETFNPLTACLSLGNGKFDHQWLMDAPDMDWKGVLENFALDWGCQYVGKEGVMEMVERRFELREGAELRGREPEMVQTIRTQLQRYTQ